MTWELQVALAIATSLGVAMVVIGLMASVRRRREITARLEMLLREPGGAPEISRSRGAHQERQGRASEPGGSRSDDPPAAGKPGRGLSRWLAEADLEIDATSFLLLVIVVGAVAALLGLLIGSHPLQAGLAGLGGLALPWWYVRSRRARRRERFLLQMPDTILLVAGGLRAGLSLLQALQRAAQEAPEPTASELKGVLRETQVGITVWAALRNLAERTGGRDLELLVAALDVHREVGGNIGPMMESMAEMMQNRQRLRGEVSVLTAQQRLAAQILFAMPVGIAFLLFLMNPGYMLELLSPEPLLCGLPVYLLAFLAALLLLIGFVVVRRASSVDV